jgi:hypothetical protein
MLRAGKIDDEIADRMLPSKALAAQAAVARRRPQPALRIHGVLPQFTGAFAGHFG